MIAYAKPRVDDRSGNQQKYSPSKELFLQNVSLNDDSKIKDFFQDCGQLVKISWIMSKDKENKKFRNCGVLEFSTQEMADKALLKNGEEFLGQKLQIYYAKPKGDKKKKKPMGDTKMGDKKKPTGDKKKKKPMPSNRLFLDNLSLESPPSD